MYESMSMCVYACKCGCHWRPEEGDWPISWSQSLKVVVSCPMQVLGNWLQSFGRTVLALNYRAISPDPLKCHFSFFLFFLRSNSHALPCILLDLSQRCTFIIPAPKRYGPENRDFKVNLNNMGIANIKKKSSLTNKGKGTQISVSFRPTRAI